MNEVTTLAAARGLFDGYGDAARLLIDARSTQQVSRGPAIYICDVVSGRTLVLLTADAAMQALSDEVALDEPMFLQVKQALDVLIADLLSSTDGIHPDTRRGVIMGAMLSITETRSFHITKQHGDNVQYLLLRYPDAAQQCQVLVPMPVFKSHPIAAAALNSTATHVLLSEQLNFPERFANDKPLSFVEQRRNVLAGTAAR